MLLGRIHFGRICTHLKTELKNCLRCSIEDATTPVKLLLPLFPSQFPLYYFCKHLVVFRIFHVHLMFQVLFRYFQFDLVQQTKLSTFHLLNVSYSLRIVSFMLRCCIYSAGFYAFYGSHLFI